MPFLTIPKTVGTTATKILDLAKNRIAYRIYNNGAAVMYIGPNNQVTTTNGYPIANATDREFRKALGDDVLHEVWAIVAAGSVDVRVLEEYE